MVPKDHDNSTLDSVWSFTLIIVGAAGITETLKKNDECV